MKFQPRPENPFPDFIATYFDRCRAVCPKLRAIAGKWTFEDLIPGMSDFDTRLIFTNDVGIRDWGTMSLAVGQVHTELAKEFPAWARILEHLPGLNLKYQEVLDPVFYYPEFQQWTYYQGDKNLIGSIQKHLREKPWTHRDEFFHLKKFAIYFGPYQRGIDPAVNLGPWENKYPLHSRFMHYFTPPVQSAVSMILKKGIAGKFEALRLAKEIFPSPEVIDMILESVQRHYEVPEYYDEPKLSAIEKTLEDYLQRVYTELSGHVTLIQIDSADTPNDLKNKVKAIPIDPVEQFYEGVKFSRFMKGRLLFFATPIAWFDTKWLIHIELGRIVKNFYDQPLKIFGQIHFKERLSPQTVLDRLKGDLLPADVCRTVSEFARVADQPILDGQEKELAYQVAQLFEPLQIMIETLSEVLYRETS